MKHFNRKIDALAPRGHIAVHSQANPGGVMNMLKRFLQEEDGATAIEYGLIAGLVAVAIITALSLLGTSLDNLFSDVATQVDGATTGP